MVFAHQMPPRCARCAARPHTGPVGAAAVLVDRAVARNAWTQRAGLASWVSLGRLINCQPLLPKAFFSCVPGLLSKFNTMNEAASKSRFLSTNLPRLQCLILGKTGTGNLAAGTSQAFHR